MPSNLAHAPEPQLRVRKAERGDVDALMELEHRVFATDRLSRRSLRRFLTSPTADGDRGREQGGQLAGTAIVLFRPRSAVARLYSIAVAPQMGGRGVGADAARRPPKRPRWRAAAARIRLEVHQTNHAAISRYRKSGYRRVRPRMRATTRTAAMRCGSRSGSSPRCPALTAAPPYFHQTTEFTCGPACMMMALAWADLGRSEPSAGAASSSSFGARPPPSSWAPDRAAASPTGWRSRSSAAASRPEVYVSRRRALFPRHREVRRQAPRHAADTDASSNVRRRCSRSRPCWTPVNEFGSDAGIRRGKRGHRPRFGISHDSQRKAALDFRLRP